MQVGWAGKYNTHEVYFYCLDALPIFIAFCIYSLLHFGRYLEPVGSNLPSDAISNEPETGSQRPTGTTSSGKSMLPWGQKDRAQKPSNNISVMVWWAVLYSLGSKVTQSQWLHIKDDIVMSLSFILCLADRVLLWLILKWARLLACIGAQSDFMAEPWYRFCFICAIWKQHMRVWQGW